MVTSEGGGMSGYGDEGFAVMGHIYDTIHMGRRLVAGLGC
jgi:hypothetical protein